MLPACKETYSFQTMPALDNITIQCMLKHGHSGPHGQQFNSGMMTWGPVTKIEYSWHPTTFLGMLGPFAAPMVKRDPSEMAAKAELPAINGVFGTLEVGSWVSLP